jgi:hypothetical protein
VIFPLGEGSRRFVTFVFFYRSLFFTVRPEERSVSMGFLSFPFALRSEASRRVAEDGTFFFFLTSALFDKAQEGFLSKSMSYKIRHNNYFDA